MRDFFKRFSAIVFAGIVLIGGYYGVLSLKAYFGQKLGIVYTYEMYNKMGDVVGTHSATSTTGVAFGGATAATSSYVSRIGVSKDTANYFITPTAVTSSAGSWVTLYVEGSNDDYCWVTSSTATDVKTGDINWVDAMNHLKDTAYDSTLPAASSTNVVWTGLTVKNGKELVLTDLNFECLKLWVGAQSSTLYVGLGSK